MRNRYLILFAAVAALASCQKNEVLTPSVEYADLSATMEEVAPNKTYMDVHNNIRWSDGDQLLAFMKSSYGKKYQLKPGYVGKTYANFSLVSSGEDNDLSAGIELDHNVIYYPYSDNVECVRSEDHYCLNVVLPARQTYVADSFGNGSMAMVAVSGDNNITFKNVLGGMKLQLKGTQKVAFVTLQGNDSERLSGLATVTAYTDGTIPSIAMSQSASLSVRLDCGEGVQLYESTPTEFILALPPVLFSNGFTVTVTATDAKTYIVRTDKANTVIRSSLLVMPAVSLGVAEQDKEPLEGDYVDEYGINHGQGVEIDGVVWAPVNCGYHATDYKYGKMYQWGRKYGQGYDENDASVPEIVDGPVSLAVGQDPANSGNFYISERTTDWCPQTNDLWSNDAYEYDPCPEGWRVPTYKELEGLIQHKSSWCTRDAIQGYYFSGSYHYNDQVQSIFLPASGLRDYETGEASGRGTVGFYWSSASEYSKYGGAYNITFNSGNASCSCSNRAEGNAVRCVLK